MNIKFRVPGKVMLNGAYIVLLNEPCISVPIDSYLEVVGRHCSGEGKISFMVSEGRHQNNRSYDYIFKDGEMKSKSMHKDSDLIDRIFSEAFKQPIGDLNIKASFTDGFWTPDGCKTGIGSSSCLLVAICYISFRLKCEKECKNYDEHEFYQFCMKIHRIVNKGSSGYDTATCINGSIIYTLENVQKYIHKEKHIVIGTFDNSTSSREMIKKIKVDESWNNLIRINKLLAIGKGSYEEYLDELRKISSEIVPDRQYKILKETFKIGIKKCGVSGAGGEDSIWAMVDDFKQVLELWNEKLNYLRVCTIPDKGLQAIEDE